MFPESPCPEMGRIRIRADFPKPTFRAQAVSEVQTPLGESYLNIHMHLDDVNAFVDLSGESERGTPSAEEHCVAGSAEGWAEIG